MWLSEFVLPKKDYATLFHTWFSIASQRLSLCFIYWLLCSNLSKDCLGRLPLSHMGRQNIYLYVGIVTNTHPKSNNFRFRLKYLLIHFPIFSNSFVCIFRNLYLSLENNKTNELKGDDEPFSPDTHAFFWYICFRSALATPGHQQRCKQKLHHISSANYK